MRSPSVNAGREIVGEHAAVAQRRAVDLEDANVRRAAVREAAVDDVEPLLVGREGEAVRAGEVVGHHRGAAAARIEPVDVGRQLGPVGVAFVFAVDAVARIGEPDRAVAGDHDVVRGVQRLALEAVDQDGDAAVELGARHPPGVVLAGDEAPLAIAGVAVGVVGMGAEDADVAVLLQPAHHPVVRNVQEERLLIHR